MENSSASAFPSNSWGSREILLRYDSSFHFQSSSADPEATPKQEVLSEISIHLLNLSKKHLTRANFPREAEIASNNTKFQATFFENAEGGYTVILRDKSDSDYYPELLKLAVNATVNGVLVLKPIKNRKGRIIDFTILLENFAADVLFGRKKGELLGKYLKQELPWTIESGVADLLLLAEASSRRERLKFLYRQDEVTMWFHVRAEKYNDVLIVIFSDETDKKAGENQLVETLRLLEESQQELSTANKKLEAKVVERTNQLRKTEEIFLNLSRVTTDGLWQWDCREDTIWLNESFYSNYQIQDKTTKGIGFLIELVHPEDRKLVREGLKNCILQSIASWQEEFRFGTEEEGYRFVLGRAHLLENEAGEVIHIVGSLVDITKQKEYESALESTLDKMQKINHNLKSFGNTTGTELSAPLRAITSLASWVIEEEQGLSATSRDKLNMLIAEAARASKLIVNIQQTGRKTFPVRDTDLKKLIAALRQKFTTVPFDTTIEERCQLAVDPQLAEKAVRDFISLLNSTNRQIRVRVTQEENSCTFSIKSSEPYLAMEDESLYISRARKSIESIGGYGWQVDRNARCISFRVKVAARPN